MFEDLKTLLWLLRKGPKFYATMIALILRKFRPVRDNTEQQDIARKWCEKYLVSYEECMSKLGFKSMNKEIFSMDYVKEVERKLKTSKSNFGGQGHIILIYAVCRVDTAIYSIKKRSLSWVEEKERIFDLLEDNSLYKRTLSELRTR